MNKGYRAIEAAAKAKAENRKADPETRAIRAAVLDRREAILAGEQAAIEAEKQAQPGAILAVLRHASEDELAEFARRVGQMAPRVLADMASDHLRQRQRSRQAAPQEPQEAAPVGKASSPAKSAERRQRVS